MLNGRKKNSENYKHEGLFWGLFYKVCTKYVMIINQRQFVMVIMDVNEVCNKCCVQFLPDF